MKTLLFCLVVVLVSGSFAMADPSCPDLNGTYMAFAPGTQGAIHIEQSGCDKITIAQDPGAPNPPFPLVTDFITDGRFRLYRQTPASTLQMAAFYIGSGVRVLEYSYIQYPANFEIFVRNTLLSRDEAGDLSLEAVTTAPNGRVLENFHLHYKRQTPN